jgi:HSP20 family protein
MLTTLWHPFLGESWTRFHHDMNRLFERYAAPMTTGPALAYSYPPLNVWEDGDNVYAEAELPGMQQDQLQIFVTGGDQLILEGDRQAVQPEEGIWHRRERAFGKFRRELTLPVPVDADKVDARFEHGVLLITLPKSEAARPRRITVQAE